MLNEANKIFSLVRKLQNTFPLESLLTTYRLLARPYQIYNNAFHQKIAFI